ncbi:PspA/IM30 family protein [Metabacillus sp. GX 13764]|uniref:PspA/IM30 family protein n=1 Tax=Metabacillus kandeliae TaxID=2900151 RepID=UPI001E45C190|nr:PspA/IM30 family protein [Metabacillus kandeliae]MCD7033644.1 PspA/IM30 family protein [Metabacillus kandeliae]
MGNLFHRIRQTVEADLQELFDSKEKDHPIALLNHYLRECEIETERVRKLVDRQALLKEELMKELSSASELAAKRKHQASVASQAGEMELYEFAAKEQGIYEERAARLMKSSEQAAESLQNLEYKYEEMKHKLKDMQIRRMELMGKENEARANHRMERVFNEGQSYTGEVSRFEEMEKYLHQLEQKANNDYLRSTIDEKIVILENELKNRDAKQE